MSSEDRRYEYMQKLSHELDMQQDEIDQERKRLIREQQETEDYFHEVRIALNEELDKLPRRFSLRSSPVLTVLKQRCVKLKHSLTAVSSI